MKPVNIHQICEGYGEYAMCDSLVWKWVRHFNEGCENMHDDLRSSHENLVRAVEEKIQENRQFTISSLSL
jgi:hypothetical protein